MCDLCNGTYGITDNEGWYAKFMPCPNPECRELAEQRSKQQLQAFLSNLQANERSEKAC